MNKKITFCSDNAAPFAEAFELASIEAEVLAAREKLLRRAGSGSEYTGWVDLPVSYDREELTRVKELAARIREDSGVLIVIGIGGSYLGACAAIDFLGPDYRNELDAERRNGPRIYFAGNSISGANLRSLTELIGEDDFSINIVSKSGTTLEPGIAFRFLKEKLEERYGREGAAKRIYATTDREKGALKALADKMGYETLVVPDDIGGRYSVLSPVGLLPIAVSGANIDRLMAGAAAEREELIAAPFEENAALRYAALRNLLYRKGYALEILASYEPALGKVAEWWKQLFGESEGKGHKGIFPASMNLTTDLHSLGQFVQDGARIMFETVLSVNEPAARMAIPSSEDNEDGLGYLAGKDMDEANSCAREGTIAAHVAGGVPNLLVEIEARDEESLGALFYFFEFSCAVSAYTLGVNPFDQPGVEDYKKNMLALLGKRN